MSESPAEVARDEVLLRLFSVIDSLGTYSYLKNYTFCECDDCLSQQDFFSDLRKRLQFTSLQNALIQFTSVFDNKGKYSLNLNQGTFQIQNFTRIFSDLDTTKAVHIQKSLHQILQEQKNKKLIKIIFEMRNQHIAHMRVRRFEDYPDWDTVINYHEIKIPRGFHPQNLIKLCYGIIYVLCEF